MIKITHSAALAVFMSLITTQANAGFLVADMNSLPGQMTLPTGRTIPISTDFRPQLGVEGSSGIILAGAGSNPGPQNYAGAYGKFSTAIDLKDIAGDHNIYLYSGPATYQQICHIFVGSYSGYGGRRLTQADGYCGVYQIGDSDVGITFYSTPHGMSSAW